MVKEATCIFRDHLSLLNQAPFRCKELFIRARPKTAITYSGGTISPRQQAGTAYQYAFNPREFWRRGLVFLESYCNAAKGNTFQKLSSADQITVLQDMFDNNPANTQLQTAFQAPNAAEFFNEVHDMVVAGFWADPLYGGNQGMVGWELLAFNANYWGDDIGLGAKKLMVAGTPTRLKPKSLVQLQNQGRQYKMSNVITHPQTDVVVCGLGHMGGPIAAEFTAAKYNVVGIEKGPFWNFATDWQQDNKDDEWAIAVERKFDHPLYISTFTISNTTDQYALPVRRYTKNIQYHALGHGVGGVGVHYGGGLGRFSPWSYQPVTMTKAKYGDTGYNTIVGNVKGGTLDLEDWPVTYDDMVPYYKLWEQAIGVVGTNQDPFIPNAKFPMPPHPDTAYAPFFKNAVKSLGYTPFPTVSGLISGGYTNQYGITRNGCVYCGWCGGLCNYPCEVGAKTSSHVSTIPAAVNTGLFDMRLDSYVFRIDTDSTGKATGVRYYDARAKYMFSQQKLSSTVYGDLTSYGHASIRHRRAI